MHLKMWSAKWRPFCLGLNVLNQQVKANSPAFIKIKVQYFLHDSELTALLNGIQRLVPGDPHSSWPPTLTSDLNCSREFLAAHQLWFPRLSLERLMGQVKNAEPAGSKSQPAFHKKIRSLSSKVSHKTVSLHLSSMELYHKFALIQ